MKEKIEKLIIELAQDFNDEIDSAELENPNLDTRIYGAGGNFTSLQLVSFLADIEGVVSDEFGCDIVIADERAMSQKISPFRSIRSLAAYTEKLIHEAKQ